MAAEPRPLSLPRWLSAMLLVAVALILAFMVWSLLSSQRRVSAEQRRNFHILTVITESISGWLPNLRTMARANLMASQLLAPEARKGLAGWQARADLYNPRLGQVRIHYAIVGNREACPGEKPPPPIFSSEGEMTIRGRTPLSDILVYDLKRADQLRPGRPLVGSRSVVELLNARLKGGRLGPKSGSDGWLTAAWLCFSTFVRLRDLVELDTPSTPIVALLILDDKKQIVTKLGSDRPPINDQQGIVVSPPISQSLIDTIFRTENKSEAPGKAVDQEEVERLGSFPVDIAGSAYTAYAMPFTVPDAASGVPEHFFAVGLIPRRLTISKIGEMPPTIVTGFTLAFAFLLALWPVVKLRLIGGGEAMSRLEVRAVGFGLVAAVALATVSVRFAHDVWEARGTAWRDAQRTAENMRGRFEQELRRSVDAARLSLGRIGLPSRRAREPSDLDVSPIEIADFSGDKLPPRPRPDRRPTCLETRIPHAPGFPELESFFVADAEGEQLPRTSILAWRRCPGGRPDLTGRAYFQQAVAGHLLASAAERSGNGGVWRQPEGVNWTLSERYAIGQIRSQADGISKTIIAFQARPGQPGRSRAGEPAAAAATSVTVLGVFVAPALPPGLSYMVIDAADPSWPVIFHTDPSRVDLEKLERELASRTAAEAIGRLMPSPSQGEPLPATGSTGTGPVVRFTGTYDGSDRLFAGVALPGTPWVLLVHADVAKVDLPATQTARETFRYLLIVAVLAAFLILLEHQAVRMYDRPRWARRIYRLRTILGLAERDAEARSRGFLLPTLLMLLAACAVAADLVGAPSYLILPAVLLAALATFVYLLPIGSRAFDARPETSRTKDHLGAALIALLILTGVVPAWTIYSDAARYVADRQASRDVTTLLASLDRATKARREVLTSFDPMLRNEGQQSDVAVFCRHPMNPGWGSGRRSGILGRENVFVAFGCPGRARLLKSDSWVENAARLTGDVFAPAYTRCGKGACSGRSPGFTLDDVSPVRLGPLLWAALAALALGLALPLWSAARSVLRGLFGIGLAIDVNFPGLPQRNGEVDLRKDNWTMMVRPPLALARSLVTRGTEIDVASGRTFALSAPPTQEEADRMPVVFTNLEMTVRSPEGRQSALAMLEAIATWHDRLRASNSPRPPLVMLVELAPLDRLLQAYEREADMAQTAGDAQVARSQEKMRWSRLLERFHTYFFEAGRHVDPLGLDSPAAAWTAVEEVAFLPEQAIDALLEHPPEPPEPPPGRTYRLSAEEYAAAYTGPVHEWAQTFRDASPEAVVDYLRSMLVEHYQFIWTTSSWAERLAMHHLARGRLMNVETAYAISSLARRGIVVVDPLPRLMNRSFRRFVLQTEKPVLVRQWQDSLSTGAWKAARWPFAAMIGIGVLAIMSLLIDAGENLEALLPLLIAAGPVLLQMLGVIRR